MFKEPTYDEYLKATAYAKFKYKYGLVVSIIAVICFIILIISILRYGEELSNNPLAYAVKKLELDCMCSQGGQPFTITVNEQGGIDLNGGDRGVSSFEEEIKFNGS